jgi:dihydroflavonol-4-reductase
MRVLVTGANGFLASNVIRELVARGIEVRGMVRANCNEKSLQGLTIELVRGNIVNYRDVLSAATGCNVIIHAAADTSQSYSDPMPLFPVNVNGTLNVIKAAKELTVQRLIFVSTANTIGLHPDQKKSELSKLFLKSGYALSKLRAEQYILKETNSGRLNAVIVNPTFMLGAYDAKPSSGRIFLQLLKPRIVVYPVGGKNFIDVKCASTAICNAIELGQNGGRYVLAGENLSFKEFLHLLDQIEHHRSIRIMIPAVVLTAIGAIGSFIRFLGFKFELNYYNARILSTSEMISGAEAEEVLRMPKTDVSKAICDAVNWFKENGYLK